MPLRCSSMSAMALLPWVDAHGSAPRRGRPRRTCHRARGSLAVVRRSVAAVRGVAPDFVVTAPGVANGAAGLDPLQPRIGLAPQPLARELRLDLLEAFVRMLV